MREQTILICLMILLFICLLNYIVDFCFYLKNRYCRFHIGRYKNQEQWHKRVEKKAVKWLKMTPTVKITDNSRYMLLDFISGKYRSRTIQSWQKAALILGLIYSNNKMYRKRAKETALDLINDRGGWKDKPLAVDCGMLSFAILKSVSNPAMVKPAMDESLSIILKNVNSAGMISYTGGRDNPDMYVDAIGLCCPFLVLYSKVYNRPEIEKLAFRQLEMFHEYGLYGNTALPNHAFDINSRFPLGVYGWGRGTAWYIIGLMDSYPYFNDIFYKEQVKQWLMDAADCYVEFQRKDGGFGAILQRMQTYDSSTTAVMAWYYTEMQKICENVLYEEIVNRCIIKLIECTRITGAIDWCQGDTKDIGVFAQTYDIMPFAQGMVLRALNHDK